MARNTAVEPCGLDLARQTFAALLSEREYRISFRNLETYGGYRGES